MISFYNKDKNDDKTKSLAQALQASRTTRSASVTPFQAIHGGEGRDPETSTLEGTGNLLSNAGKIYSGLKDSGWFNSGNTGMGSGIFSSAINDNILGNANSYGAIGDAINTNVYGGDSGSVLQGAISENVSGGSGSGMGSSVPWAAIGKAAKTGYNGFTGKDDADYSDLEETFVYPMQGASVGAQFGPWGAAGGAAYGLGYSLKDDIGLKDNNWLTTVLFPIGMGDEHNGLIQL